MNLAQWNMTQVNEAIGEVNRYYFWKHYGRDAENAHELVMYYAEFGAEKFAIKHRGEYDAQEKENGESPKTNSSS